MERREALKKTLVALGYTISIPSLIGIFESCSNNTSQAWQPEVFSSGQASTMAELAETILPKTKTPGAKDLKLDRFIDQMIKQVFSKDDQQAFLNGMDAFEAKSKEVNGKSFVDSSSEQRTNLLTRFEQETAKEPPTIWGFDTQKDPAPAAFYRKAKELTLLGYFTSKEIGKEVLVYDPVPGRYLADVPTSQIDRIAFE